MLCIPAVRVVQGVLRRIISRRMVEPQRRYFDLNRMYMNKHIARVGVQTAERISCTASRASHQCQLAWQITVGVRQESKLVPAA